MSVHPLRGLRHQGPDVRSAIEARRLAREVAEAEAECYQEMAECAWDMERCLFTLKNDSEDRVRELSKQTADNAVTDAIQRWLAVHDFAAKWEAEWAPLHWGALGLALGSFSHTWAWWTLRQWGILGHLGLVATFERVDGWPDDHWRGWEWIDTEIVIAGPDPLTEGPR